MSEKQREYQRKWNAANRDKKRASCRKWRKNNPEKYKASDRKSKLLATYGITPTQYDNMLKSQRGACAICQAKPNGCVLHVDHTHVDGYRRMSPKEKQKYIRGLLCTNCNTMIGLANEEPIRFVNAVYYLTPVADAIAPQNNGT